MAEADFQKVLKFTAKWEGIRYTDDPADPGGATKYGVTQEIYNSYRRKKLLPVQTVAKITKDESVDIYRTMFWIESYAYLFSYPLALAIFDSQVQFASATKARFLNEALNLPQGSKSADRLEALKKLIGDETKQKDVALKIANARLNFRVERVREYPPAKKHLNGWQNRDKDLIKAINNYVLIKKIQAFFAPVARSFGNFFKFK